MSLKKENIARFGLASLGAVYVLVGILTILAAFNMGGKEAGTKKAIGFLSFLPVDKLLLAIIGIGLFSYAFWRFYQTFMDSRNLGTDVNALFTRAGYLTGGLFYGFLGFIALKLMLGGSTDNRQDLLVNTLNSKYGFYFAAIFGLVLVGKAIFEIYFVLSNKFKKNVQSSEMNSKVKPVLLKFGVIGHSARGLVFAIMGFLTMRTVLTFRNKDVSTVEDAFQFLDFKFGAVVLALVAIGLFCYGLFMFVKAKYLYINMN